MAKSQRALALPLLLIPFAMLVFSPPAEARRHRKGAAEKLADAAADKFEEALLKAPVDNEVCFSPEGHCDLKLVKFIQSAQETLDVAIFDINRDPIVHAIAVAATSRKVKVRLLVDMRQAKSENSAVPFLIRAGIPVRIGYQRGIMHNKFTIVDGKRIETGSFNYTNGASEKNNENQIYLGEPSVVARYAKRFDEIWSAGTSADFLRDR